VIDPAADTSMFPGDEIMLLGTTEQLDIATELLATPAKSPDSGADCCLLMDQIFLAHDSTLTGETLSGARIRQTYGVTVAGVQRGQNQHLSPGPEFVLKSGDVILVAGRVEFVNAFRKVAAGGLEVAS
jgi:K+/H+ antiporter YhaU regulatory subunit KhtT